MERFLCTGCGHAFPINMQRSRCDRCGEPLAIEFGPGDAESIRTGQRFSASVPLLSRFAPLLPVPTFRTSRHRFRELT